MTKETNSVRRLLILKNIVVLSVLKMFIKSNFKAAYKEATVLW